MSRSHTVDELRAAFTVALEAATSAEDLQNLRDQYLGRKRGAVQAILKSVADAPAEERRTLGKNANQLKNLRSLPTKKGGLIYETVKVFGEGNEHP